MREVIVPGRKLIYISLWWNKVHAKPEVNDSMAMPVCVPLWATVPPQQDGAASATSPKASGSQAEKKMVMGLRSEVPV
jgi:hypothetical protein